MQLWLQGMQQSPIPITLQTAVHPQMAFRAHTLEFGCIHADVLYQ